jgi:microcystin-dependent protein
MSSEKPFSNLQPSLVVTELTVTQGIFPSNGGGGFASGDTLGFVYDFAGNFAPGTSLALQGQTLPISPYTAMFSLLGNNYGGNGTSNFDLPNLEGTVAIGAGAGPDLPTQVLGERTGSETVTLSASQIPTSTMNGQPFDNMQPSLPMTALIATSGVFASEGGGIGSATFLGQIANFAGNFVPDGWMPADGQLLSISQNQALFAILGTTYGGNGITTFALPDLRGRAAVGADAAEPIGSAFGNASTTLTAAQLPVDSAVPGVTGGGKPVPNDQPSLAVNYIIATSGIFPSNGANSGFEPNTPVLGQISEFAGDFAPSGWAFADGQLLPIAQNQALFAILGTQYGGNGVTTFALPNMRGRVLIGSGLNNPVGSTFGSDTTKLTVANLPVADQPVCFLAGTVIATPDGNKPVEQLAPGDLVLTHSGQARPIVWVGTGRVLAARGRRNAATPVIVRKGALASNVPFADLRVTKAHSFYIDNTLIPVEFLINHRTIAWDDHAQEVALHHIELETHDVLIANGAPAESYRDDGNRWLFQNANMGWDFPAKQPCAAVATGGPVVDAVWRRLLDRSGPRAGFPLTSDPDLHLIVDGQRVNAGEQRDLAYTFTLPSAARSVRIVSRAGIQSELGLVRDPRCLGVAIRQLVLSRGTLSHAVNAADPALTDGFHPYEEDNLYRWTDGDATLPASLLEAVPGATMLALHIGEIAHYVDDGRPAQAA